MNKKRRELRFKSGTGNNYLISRAIPQVMLIHPILNFLLELAEKGIDLEKWIDNLDVEETEIEVGIKAKKKEILYYYEYLPFLEKNGYFGEVKKYNMTGTIYTAEIVKAQLANTQQIVFEVCDFCSLECAYCAYGNLYTGYDRREGKMLSISTAKKLFDYMVSLFESPLNRKLYKRIYISFYGGEPLLNMPFIKEMVRYARSKKLLHKEFCFSMTTNAVSIDKHLDFLIKNDFRLLISLDGHAINNSYRVFPDGSPSYDTIYTNIVKLKQEYPSYFDRMVDFNAVLHNKNSHKEIVTFFRENFGKEPIIAEVNSIGIKPEKKEEFQKIFKRKYSGLKPKDIIEDIKDKSRILKTPFVKKLATFIHRYSGFVFKNYDRLIHSKENVWHVSTGTCHPFEKKIFLTTNCKILTCERILHTYSLGKVDKKGVHIDFQEIADKYNLYYKKMMNKCNRCFNSEICSLCIFTLNLVEESPKCDRYMNEEKFKKKLRDSLSLLDETPKYYPRILKDYQIN